MGDSAEPVTAAALRHAKHIIQWLFRVVAHLLARLVYRHQPFLPLGESTGGRSLSSRPPHLDPTALSQLGPLATLPNDVLEKVCSQTGLHTRQVCRALRALHPPLLSLAPHGSHTPAGLNAALAALPPTLTSLDLSGIHRAHTRTACRISACPAHPGPCHITTLPHPVLCGYPITPAALATIATTLPNLQSLALPLSLPDCLSPALLTTLQACPRLHTLHAPGLDLDVRAQDYQPPPNWVFDLDDIEEPNWTPLFAPLFAPPIATHIRCLTLRTSALDLIAASPAASLPHLTSFHLSQVGRRPVLAGKLRHLASAAPSLRSLTIIINVTTSPDQHLDIASCMPESFASLDELHFCYAGLNGSPGVLHHVASMTRMHTLALRTRVNWAGARAAWLDPLTRLTCLDLDLGLRVHVLDGAAGLMVEPGPADPDGRRITTGLAASIAELPLLLALHIEFWNCQPAWLAVGEQGSFFQRLAAATQLRSLCLQSLPLPPTEVGLLTSLRGLTALKLIWCRGMEDDTTLDGPDPPTLQWVAALPNLQRFSWETCWYGRQ